jgi:hypothetical protein
MTRHKHADILIAIAEGNAIQVRGTANHPWRDWTDSDVTPLTKNVYDTVEWRIKPGKKTGWIAIGKSDICWIDEEKENAIKQFKAEYQTTPIACIAIEYIEGEGL